MVFGSIFDRGEVNGNEILRLCHPKRRAKIPNFRAGGRSVGSGFRGTFSIRVAKDLENNTTRACQDSRGLYPRRLRLCLLPMKPQPALVKKHSQNDPLRISHYIRGAYSTVSSECVGLPKVKLRPN